MTAIVEGHPAAASTTSCPGASQTPDELAAATRDLASVGVRQRARVEQLLRELGADPCEGDLFRDGDIEDLISGIGDD
jgi:hypothetical protein